MSSKRFRPLDKSVLFPYFSSKNISLRHKTWCSKEMHQWVFLLSARNICLDCKYWKLSIFEYIYYSLFLKLMITLNEYSGLADFEWTRSLLYLFLCFWHTVNVLIFRTLDACQNSLDKQCSPRSDCFWRSSLIRVFPVCYSDEHFVNSNPENQHFFLEKKENSVRNFRTFTVLQFSSFIACLI